MKKEEWKRIKDFPNYKVSSIGRIYSDIKKDCLKGFFHKGYPRVLLSNKGKSKRFLVHKLVAKYFIENNDPKKIFIDHINRKRDDNRIENLRYVTHQENCCNNGAKGYFYLKSRNKWTARIKINYKTIDLGNHDTEEEARKARKDAEKIYFAAIN